jgi:hypothetical protein
MGSKWFTGGVAAAPRGRIQFDFRLDGVRYRPTIKRPPSSSATLRGYRKILDGAWRPRLGHLIFYRVTFWMSRTASSVSTRRASPAWIGAMCSCTPPASPCGICRWRRFDGARRCGL